MAVVSNGLFLIASKNLSVGVYLDDEHLGVLHLTSLDQFLRLRQILNDDDDPSEFGVMTEEEWQQLEQACVS